MQLYRSIQELPRIFIFDFLSIKINFKLYREGSFCFFFERMKMDKNSTISSCCPTSGRNKITCKHCQYCFCIKIYVEVSQKLTTNSSICHTRMQAFQTQAFEDLTWHVRLMMSSVGILWTWFSWLTRLTFMNIIYGKKEARISPLRSFNPLLSKNIACWFLHAF